MIILSGFTVSIADEVKSRTNAFKVYHMGTMFYFAAETLDDLSMWLEWFSTATIADGHNLSMSNTNVFYMLYKIIKILNYKNDIFNYC